MSCVRNEAGPEGNGGDCCKASLPGFRRVGTSLGECARISFDSTHRRCYPATATENKIHIEPLEEQAGVRVRVESHTTFPMEAHIKTFLLPASCLPSARQGQAAACRR